MCASSVFPDPASAAELRDSRPQLVWSRDEKSLMGLLFKPRSAKTFSAGHPIK
jgi:hypothetical protein